MSNPKEVWEQYKKDHYDEWYAKVCKANRDESKRKATSESIKQRLAQENWWVGRKHTEETKQKMSESMKGKGVGASNSQYGTAWIYNTQLKKNLKVKTSEIATYLDQGWQVGRKMKF